VSDLAIEDIIRLETEVWRALVSGDAVADARLLAEDFLGVYPTDYRRAPRAEGTELASDATERRSPSGRMVECSTR
jgi:hypothetical protein